MSLGCAVSVQILPATRKMRSAEGMSVSLCWLVWLVSSRGCLCFVGSGCGSSEAGKGVRGH